MQKAISLKNVTNFLVIILFYFRITGYQEDLFYIYTSGTTGLPKANNWDSTCFYDDNFTFQQHYSAVLRNRTLTIYNGSGSDF
jgi:hypothetical protein